MATKKRPSKKTGLKKKVEKKTLSLKQKSEKRDADKAAKEKAFNDAVAAAIAKRDEKALSEAHRQANVPQQQRPRDLETDADGSHAIDHLTILDNHVSDDTNKEAIEDIKSRNESNLSFWGGSWIWVKAERSYGNKPEDKWFINPAPQLIGEVMRDAPLIHGACELALIGEHKEQLDRERTRHIDFLRMADGEELISECLDMLTGYQGRYFEAVQRYIGLEASYQTQIHNDRATEEQVELAVMRKKSAGDQCRSWVARLISLREAYQAVISDDRAYNLKYDFAPSPTKGDGSPNDAYGLYKWSVTQALGKIGKRLARSIKSGKMDADKYRIPRPWLEEQQLANQRDANEMVSDFT